MKIKLSLFFVVLLGFCSFLAKPVYAEGIPDVAPPSGVYDPHGYLSKDVEKEVTDLNNEYSKTALRPQIAIAVVDTVDGDIESVAREAARNWHVGFSATNYGTLVLISIKDRKIRTETSNNMGTIITDVEASNLNDSIQDDFRQENYSAGLRTYLAQFKNKVEPYLSKKNAKEIAEYQEKQRQENIKKYGPIGAALFSIWMIAFMFISYKIAKYSKAEEEYYEKYGHSKNSIFGISSGSGSSGYYSDSGSSSSSSSSSSSWSGGGFDGGGSTGGW